MSGAGSNSGLKLGFKPDERSLVEALERCAMPIKVERDHNRRDGEGKEKSEKEREREVALRFAEDVWKEWEVVEERGMQSEKRVNARMVERANSAMIRILALYVSSLPLSYLTSILY